MGLENNLANFIRQDGEVDENTEKTDQNPEENSIEENTKNPNSEESTEEVVTNEETNSEENSEDEENIFGDIDKLTGFGISGEFEDTTEGFAKYSTEAYKLGRTNFENEIRERYPKSYQYLLHEANGGNPYDLLEITADEKKEVDNDLDAEQIIREELLSKGLNEQIVKASLDIYKDNNLLVDEANKLVVAHNKELSEKAESKLREQEELRLKQEEYQKNILMNVSEFIKSGKMTGHNNTEVMIPEKEKKGFNDFVNSSMTILNNGQVALVHTLENMDDLQYAYFRYKKGDLSNVVANRKNSNNIRTLKRTGNPASKPKDETSKTLRSFYNQ